MKNILYWFIEGQTHFGMPRGAKIGLVLNKGMGYFSFRFKHFLLVGTTSGKKVLILYAEQPLENHRAPTTDKMSY